MIHWRCTHSVSCAMLADYIYWPLHRAREQANRDYASHEQCRYTAIVMRYKLTFSLPHNIFFTFWFVSIRFIYLTLYIGRSGGMVRWAFRGSTSIPRSYMRIVTVATSHQVYGASGSLCTCFSVSRSELILQSIVHEGTASDPWWSDGEYNVTIIKKKQISTWCDLDPVSAEYLYYININRYLHHVNTTRNVLRKSKKWSPSKIEEHWLL